MDTSTFVWSVIGALVVAGLGFGSTKYYMNRKNIIKGSQIQIGSSNEGIYKSHNVTVNKGVEQGAKKDPEQDKK
jgi:hypothetical protein